jgi:hypothetical protein
VEFVVTMDEIESWPMSLISRAFVVKGVSSLENEGKKINNVLLVGN